MRELLHFNKEARRDGWGPELYVRSIQTVFSKYITNVCRSLRNRI